MAISLNSVKRGSGLKPTIDLWYAPQGMGKTTIAAGMPEPIFLQTEDGLGELDMPTFGMLKSYEEVVDAIKALATEDHPFKSAILDSAGWLQPLVWDATCRANGWANIEAPGYGKGPIAALNYWRTLLDGFSYLRDNKGMGIAFLAHADVKKVEPPDGEDYERYQPKLHKDATAMLQEYCDDVFFINTRVSVTRSSPQDKNSRGVAVGTDQRFVYTSLKATHMAKNRWSMPSMIPLPAPSTGQAPDPFTLFATVAQYIPYYRGLLNPPAAETPPIQPDDPIPGMAANPFADLGAKKNEAEAENQTSETKTNETAEATQAAAE